MEDIHKEIDLFDLPDSDTVEGNEPDYQLIVASFLLLVLGTFLFLRQYIRNQAKCH